MSKPKHTTEPWIIHQIDKFHTEIGPKINHGALHICVCKMDGLDFQSTRPAMQEACANAERIVACVNACKGLNPEAVPEMLWVLKEVVANYPDNKHEDYELPGYVILAKTLIAKATEVK